MARWSGQASSLRFRATVLVTLVLVAALITGGVALVYAQTQALNQAIDTGLDGRATDLANLVADGVIPNPITVAGDEQALAQIIDPGGMVVASSANIEGEEPISSAEPPQGAILHGVVRDLPVEERVFRFAATSVATPAGLYRVYVAASVEVRTEAVAALVAALIVGIPVLSVVVAATGWVVIGRTLNPVEEIRSEVEAITGSELHRRVPQPAHYDEIGRLARTMNTMLERLERSSKQQDEFVSNAAHELRSPLAGIRAELEVDAAHPRPDAWQETRDSALAEAIRLQTLIDDLLLLAKTDSGTRSWTEVDLDDLVGQAGAKLRVREAITVDSSSILAARVTGDANQLLRVVINLLENAERHATSLVKVSLHSEGQRVLLTVEDDGSGVPEANRQMIFRRFARSDEARARDEGGSGLGLAIASEIVHRHGGTIAVGNSSIGGAAFTVELPRDIHQS